MDKNKPIPLAIDPIQGEILMVNKPLGWTSFDVVKKIRNTFNLKKVGHAGTLDPLATGLLLICTGKQTKQISSLQTLEKVYRGCIALGKTTPSMDLETPFNSKQSYTHITNSMIQTAAHAFIGTIEQIPPIYSAIHVNGQRAYKLARTGRECTLSPREVTITAFKLLKIELPFITFELVCSKGTYVRRIAHDLGQQLGVGGYLHALERIKIGPYKLEQAYNHIETLSHPQAQGYK